ncbi:MAG: hypothetical protein U0Q16_13695 [Bryobacteraceae bacterium]
MMRLLLVTFAGACAAADLSGVWVGTMPNRNGDLLDVAFQFTNTNGKLGGKQYGDYGSSPIVDFKHAGELVTFVVAAQEQAGNQINETRIRYTGTVRNGEMELVRERERSTNAGNSGGTQTARNPPKQTVKLKRLYN